MEFCLLVKIRTYDNTSVTRSAQVWRDEAGK